MKLGQVNGLWIGVGLGRGREVTSVKERRGICSAWAVNLFGALAEKCNAAYSSLEDAFKDVRGILHIFGFKPGRNFDNSTF